MPDLRAHAASAASTTARTGTSPAAACARPPSVARSPPAASGCTSSCTRSCRGRATDRPGTTAGPARCRSAQQVGQRQQGQQQHPQHHRAPHQADHAVAGGRSAAARRRSSRRRWPCRQRRRCSKVLDRSGVTPGAAAPPSCTPTAPAAAARMTPSLACCHSPASRRQPLTASSKLPTTAKPNAVRRAGTWSISANRRCDSSHQLVVGRRVERALLEGPVAAGELGHAVEHRTGRAQAERRAARRTRRTRRTHGGARPAANARSRGAAVRCAAARWRRDGSHSREQARAPASSSPRSSASRMSVK